MHIENVTRKQAFFTHLGISLSVFLIMLVLIVVYWYPSFLLFMDGGDRGIATIFFVDVVLGPGLTLLVFKPGKPGLKFDVAFILVVQLAALTWGVSKVYEDRSVATAFYLGKFSCLGATSAEQVPDAISRGGPGSQKLAFLRRPDTIQEYTTLLNTAMNAGSSEVYYYADRFESIDAENVARIKSYRLDIEAFRKEDAEGAAAVDAFVAQNPGFGEQYGLYPLVCRFGDAMVVFDFETRRIEQVLDHIKPDPMIRAASTIPLVP